MIDKFTISELLPHRPPMQLITAIESIDLKKQIMVARIDINREDLLYQSNIDGVPSWISLEYMAQAIGCFIGYGDHVKNPLATPVVGFVLGTRKLSVEIPTYLAGQSYFIHISSLFCDNNMANFECKIYNQTNEIVASAAINVFRPDDIEQFMGKQHE